MLWITFIRTNVFRKLPRKNIFRKAEELRKLNNFMATVARIRRLHKEVYWNYWSYHITVFSVIPYMLNVFNISLKKRNVRYNLRFEIFNRNWALPGSKKWPNLRLPLLGKIQVQIAIRRQSSEEEALKSLRSWDNEACTSKWSSSDCCNVGWINYHYHLHWWGLILQKILYSYLPGFLSFWIWGSWSVILSHLYLQFMLIFDDISYSFRFESRLRSATRAGFVNLSVQLSKVMNFNHFPSW